MIELKNISGDVVFEFNLEKYSELSKKFGQKNSIEYAILDGVEFNQIDLTRRYLTNIDFSKIKTNELALSDSYLDKCKFSNDFGSYICEKTKFVECDFTEVDIEKLIAYDKKDYGPYYSKCIIKEEYQFLFENMCQSENLIDFIRQFGNMS